jgi:hypothetical protein
MAQECSSTASSEQTERVVKLFVDREQAEAFVAEIA